MLEETLTLFKVVSQSFKNKTGPSLTADVVLPLISTFSNDIVVFALFTFILEFFPTYFKFFRVKLDFLLSTNLNLESFSFIKLFPPPSISITLVPTVISFPEISMSFAKYIFVFVGSAVISCITFFNSSPEETVTSFAIAKLLLPTINDRIVEYNNIFFLRLDFSFLIPITL